MANEIVNLHQELISFPLKKFNAAEMDILLAICYGCQKNGGEGVIIKIEDIKKLAHYKGKDGKILINEIRETNRKLMDLKFSIGGDGEYIDFVLFPTFRVSETEGIVEIEVNKKFSYLLNNLSNYTSLELRESASLKSKYSKDIYKKLRQYRKRKNPFWKVSLEDFREYLDLPTCLIPGMIDARVINPSIKELSRYFEDLSVEKYYKKSTGRGRPTLDGYIFTFERQDEKAEDIAEKLGYEKTPRYCPKCKNKIYRKRLIDEKGSSYYLYGHPDFKTGACGWNSFRYEDTLEKSVLTEINEPQELSEEEQEIREENKKKVSELISGWLDDHNSDVKKDIEKIKGGDFE